MNKFIVNPANENEIISIEGCRDEIKRLYKELNEAKEIIEKINNYLDNYDVFKVFTFPLMKRWEEQQIKSSIDYEFKTSLIKDLKEILEDKEV